jgi:hypothetical protein
MKLKSTEPKKKNVLNASDILIRTSFKSGDIG